MDKTTLYRETYNETAKLIIIPSNGDVKEVLLTDSCVIGRESASSNAEIQVDSSIASRRHGEFTVSDDKYYYRDLDSLNGTFINGIFYGKDAIQAMVRLENGDIIRIDKKGTGRHKDSLVIIFVRSYPQESKWEPLKLTNEVFEVNIGRAPSSGGLFLDNKMVSKNHATFFRWANGWAIDDHASVNGVYVNNIRITEPVTLGQLDVVRIADMHFILCGISLLYQHINSGNRNPQKPDGASLVISIIERNVWQRFKKMTLLQNINLTIGSGEMVMILGGSGAGKTTFMNAVMGYEKADGKILHGETDIYKEYDLMKYEIGFVPQQDLLRGSDTVYDTLRNAAEMKMSRNISNEQKAKRIAEVLELLGLQREKNSLVSKLSGGQRKRLSIAVEYISDPSLFFLDEPDSGLDGIMARSLNENLRTIADDGKIVMVITHSPDRIADLYNKVIVLAKSTEDNCGYLAFYGSIQDAFDFFETDSLEGVVKKINRPDEGGDGKSDFYIKKFAQHIG